MDGIVLLCGIPTEPPLALAERACRRLGLSFATVHQRFLSDVQLNGRIEQEGLTGYLRLPEGRIALSDIRGVYTRMMDFPLLPELKGVPESDPLYQHHQQLHQQLSRLFEIMPGRVVNRARAMGSNSSKPYQLQSIRRYFSIPETLITDDAAGVIEFRRRHRRIIYKSTSGYRSIVQEFTDNDLARLADLRWCPAQFQQYIFGLDVRVHVIGTHVFATAVHSDGIDYRYAHREGFEPARLEGIELDGTTRQAAIGLTREFGLDFSGIDLRIGPGGEVFCFEVNPAPAYSYYEEHTGQRISETLAAYLAHLC